MDYSAPLERLPLFLRAGAIVPMLGHGQIEGFSEKYGMEYRRAMWDEQVDEEMVRRHERDIFPLMRRRRLFSGAENFALFDFEADGGWVDENVFAYSNRLGDERALIIYNNSYDSTSGRIRLSSAINTGSAENPRLEQRTLSQALALPADRDHWCLFRDHMDGLEYLRSCPELARDGFHTFLRGYQYRALVDFRIIRDVDGSWARLATHLQGGGTPDLERALRRVEIAPALAGVRRLAGPDLMAWFETMWVGEEDGPPGGRADQHGEETGTPPFPADLLPVVEAMVRLPRLVSTTGLGPRTAGDLKGLLARIPGSRIPQAVYLCHGLRLLPGPWNDLDALEVDGCVLRSGDADLLLEEITTELQAWTGHEYAAWSTAALAGILARSQEEIEAMAAGRTDWLVHLLDDTRVQAYLGVNWHRETRWLRQEPLETLLDAMAVCCLVAEPRANPTNFLDSRALIMDYAVKSNFQMDRFRTFLKDFS